MVESPYFERLRRVDGELVIFAGVAAFAKDAHRNDWGMTLHRRLHIWSDICPAEVMMNPVPFVPCG
jgi:hypothetical protein